MKRNYRFESGVIFYCAIITVILAFFLLTGCGTLYFDERGDNVGVCVPLYGEKELEDGEEAEEDEPEEVTT